MDILAEKELAFKATLEQTVEEAKMQMEQTYRMRIFQNVINNFPRLKDYPDFRDKSFLEICQTIENWVKTGQ